MAQVSVQYVVDPSMNHHDMATIKKGLDQFHGVKSVSINTKTNVLCIDYDNTGVKENELIQYLQSLGYSLELLDQITF